VFSEQGLEEYGSLADESGLSSTELDNSVSRREKRGTKNAYYAIDELGKKTRSSNKRVTCNEALCMKTWLTQVQELEKMMTQDY
jgi:hypothetical protein